MYIIPTTVEEVLQEFPYIEDWIEASSTFLKKDIDRQKIEFYYSYGYFVSVPEDRELYNKEIKEFYSNLYFEERLNFELSKVKVNLTMRVGHFILSNRLKKGDVPNIISKIVKEITKVKMTIEGENHGKQNIIDSIPPIDRSVISYKLVRDNLVGDIKSESDNLDIDTLLDKISKFGIESLSKEEKEYLDKKSKDF